MRTTDGILEFEYRSVLKKIRFSLDLSPGYGGLPLLLVQDKFDHFHTFVRDAASGWRALGKTPAWPSEFLVMLFMAIEEKYIEIKSQTKI